MVKCVCINDIGRPEIIPISKWIKKDNIYHIIEVVVLLPSNELGVKIKEINLTKKEAPYEFFKLERFGFLSEDDLKEFFQLLEDCMKMDKVLEKNMQEFETKDVLERIKKLVEELKE